MNKREMLLIFEMWISCYKIIKLVNNTHACVALCPPTKHNAWATLAQNCGGRKTDEDRQEHPRIHMSIH